MASSREYLDFILEQLSGLDEVSYRPMMGEYILYYQGKVIGGIYDDRFLVKPVRSAKEMMPDAEMESPYEGAREMLAVRDVDNREFLKALLEAMADELLEKKGKRVSKEVRRKKLSVIFQEKPERWGFRGDPYFWDYLKERAEKMDILSPEELEEWIKEEFLSLSGKPLTDEYMDFAVIKQFAHGGMSSGGVDNRWWMREGIPLLKDRLKKL